MAMETGTSETSTAAQPESAPNQSDLVQFDLRALTRFQEDRISVTVLSDIGAARVVLFAFEAGQELKEHETSSQILVQVLRGRIAFTAAGRTEVARAGTLFQLEANVRHSIVAHGRAVVLVTMAPSPAQHSLQREVFDQLTPLVARKPGA